MKAERGTPRSHGAGEDCQPQAPVTADHRVVPSQTPRNALLPPAPTFAQPSEPSPW